MVEADADTTTTRTHRRRRAPFTPPPTHLKVDLRLTDGTMRQVSYVEMRRDGNDWYFMPLPIRVAIDEVEQIMAIRCAPKEGGGEWSGVAELRDMQLPEGPS